MSAMADALPISSVSIVRLSSIVQRRLDQSSVPTGRVHSVFERCLNVQWRDESLLVLHGPGPLAAPFAASLGVLPSWDSIGAGTAVWTHGGRLRVGSLVIDAQAGASVDLSVPPAAEGPQSLGAWLSDLPAEAAAPTLDSATGRMARERLAAGIRGDDGDAFLAGARALIGLGEGLTPAGDDCLVGALGALWRFAPRSIGQHPVVRHELARAAAGGTTTVAREFILHALEGRFSELVVAILVATSPGDARRAATLLGDTGATSGADTLTGLRLALQALSATGS